jgi:hypothetical protein
LSADTACVREEVDLLLLWPNNKETTIKENVTQMPEKKIRERHKRKVISRWENEGGSIPPQRVRTPAGEQSEADRERDPNTKGENKNDPCAGI